MTKYRVNRDWYYSQMWAVEKKTWLGFWIEVRGMLRTKQEAIELIDLLKGGDAS